MADTVTDLIKEGKDITIELTDSEKVRFQECEKIIKKGLNTFLEVGGSLAEIRDNRLYRETHKTFEKYCKDIWDISRMHAHRQIQSYQMVLFLEEKCNQLVTNSELDPEETPPQIEIILPVNEAQTRPLTKLDPDDQVKAWGMVLEQLNDGKKLTASLVNKAAKQLRGEAVKKKLKNQKQAVESTQLVSNLFKKQFQVMLDILSEERNTGWKTTSKKEAAKWLKNLVKIAEGED
ncbi:MAG: hypothetical protein KKF12_18080 [Proteobacteria bacterium]|nr:hypothetical protein [Desulfobacula sp.]MBU3952067.1 hypothetical protein [Pseudomonadota bacterium]MBU4132729.1 hypothetical protein [Pseudomonadota bacterium]